MVTITPINKIIEYLKRKKDFLLWWLFVCSNYVMRVGFWIEWRYSTKTLFGKRMTNYNLFGACTHVGQGVKFPFFSPFLSFHKSFNRPPIMCRIHEGQSVKKPNAFIKFSASILFYFFLENFKKVCLNFYSFWNYFFKV